MKKILISFLLMCAVFALHADLSGSLSYAGDANTPAAFLYLPVGAKAIGTGQAFSILGDDPTAAFYNPSSLVRLRWSGISITGSSLSMDRYHTAFSLAICSSNTNGERRVTAFSGSFLLVDELYSYTDNTGVAGGALDSYSGTLGFSMAFESASKRNWGFTASAVFDRQDDTTGIGAAVSAGFEVPVLVLKVSASVRNLGFIYYSDMKWLRPTVSGALSTTMMGLVLRPVLQYDYTFGVRDSGVLRFGMDWVVINTRADEQKDKSASDAVNNYPGTGDGLTVPKKSESRGVRLVVRAGIADGAFAGGFSLLLDRIEVSYAISMSDFEESDGAMHTVSLNYYF